MRFSTEIAIYLGFSLTASLTRISAYFSSVIGALASASTPIFNA